jgi:hypothetical protein
MIDAVGTTESGGEPEHPCPSTPTINTDDYKIYKRIFS